MAAVLMESVLTLSTTHESTSLSNSEETSATIERHRSYSLRRRSTVSKRPLPQDFAALEEHQSLTLTASAISGHLDAYQESLHNVPSLPYIVVPKPVRPGRPTTIHEVPSGFNTPVSTRPSTPVHQTQSLVSLEVDDRGAHPYPDIGTISSFRGAMILIITCGSQLLDNVFMTGVNISLPAIQTEFNVKSSDLQWLISAYTLTFGGFLLLAGVLADRHGRRRIFYTGMLILSIFTLANGLSTSFIQLCIFRALQGLGAAMTVPSSVGIISSYFVSQQRTLALSIYAAAGAIGFCAGLISGGFLTSTLGWRYVFRIAVIITSSLGSLGFFLLPKDRLEGLQKPKLDLLGAGLSTGGLVLLSFVLSSGGVYGWNKAFIIALLILSISMLAIFTWVERKVSNPIMPLSLWKLPNFAALWIAGFVTYGSYQTTIYYTVLIAQQINHLTPLSTALRFLPMGAVGFIASLLMARVLERFNTKAVLLFGMLLCILAPIPSSIIKDGDVDFWIHVLPTTLLIVTGVTIVYSSCTILLLSSAPTNVKSLCGGMINTAFQIGSGVGLALATAIVQAVVVGGGEPNAEGEEISSLLRQYSVGLWCCVAFAGVGGVVAVVGVKAGGEGKGKGEGDIVGRS